MKLTVEWPEAEEVKPGDIVYLPEECDGRDPEGFYLVSEVESGEGSTPCLMVVHLRTGRTFYHPVREMERHMLVRGATLQIKAPCAKVPNGQ